MSKPRILIAAVVIGAVAISTGCSQKNSAERDGKKLGQAICDLRDAENQDEATEALDDANEQLNDLGNKYALYTAEDRADVDNNLADLAEHAIQGQPTLAQQDLTVLERSVNNISEDLNETSQAAWEGLLQGLSECTQ
jgi:basic membrane lipoprotein Med (substrate-binding protein (PBP1-ABC) superfamily)